MQERTRRGNTMSATTRCMYLRVYLATGEPLPYLRGEKPIRTIPGCVQIIPNLQTLGNANNLTVNTMGFADLKEKLSLR